MASLEAMTPTSSLQAAAGDLRRSLLLKAHHEIRLDLTSTPLEVREVLMRAAARTEVIIVALDLVDRLIASQDVPEGNPERSGGAAARREAQG